MHMGHDSFICVSMDGGVGGGKTYACGGGGGMCVGEVEDVV